ncbi:hypothetical protein [Streptomyces sp. NPDC052701]|uniref:hypothetical protein n=1 Tax=Streptomyces sp. NPDC052701 TaxID=3155533 RepID=UPI00344A1767
MRLAGFHLVGEASDGTPGMRVNEIPSGALVSWTPLGGLGALAGARPGPGGPAGSVVRAAVQAVLLQHGYVILTGSAGDDLVVLPPARVRSSPGPGEPPSGWEAADADEADGTAEDAQRGTAGVAGVVEGGHRLDAGTEAVTDEVRDVTDEVRDVTDEVRDGADDAGL